jgi:hypothetical protein
MNITVSPNKSNRPKRKEESITGRDGYIVAKALAYAITTIERSPEKWQEFSDMEDMKLIFDHNFGPLSMVFVNAKRHIDGARSDSVDYRLALLEAYYVASAFQPGDTRDNLLEHIDIALHSAPEDMSAAFETIIGAMDGGRDPGPVDPAVVKKVYGAFIEEAEIVKLFGDDLPPAA